jgi:hypothetical protein
VLLGADGDLLALARLADVPVDALAVAASSENGEPETAA